MLLTLCVSDSCSLSACDLSLSQAKFFLDAFILKILRLTSAISLTATSLFISVSLLSFQ